MNSIQINPNNNGTITSKDLILYQYTPSAGAADTYMGLFGVATLAHFIMMFPYRTWYFISFIIGGVSTFLSSHLPHHNLPYALRNSTEQLSNTIQHSGSRGLLRPRLVPSCPSGLQSVHSRITAPPRRPCISLRHSLQGPRPPHTLPQRFRPQHAAPLDHLQTLRHERRRLLPGPGRRRRDPSHNEPEHPEYGAESRHRGFDTPDPGLLLVHPHRGRVLQTPRCCLLCIEKEH